MTTHIQYASDLHIEFYDKTPDWSTFVVPSAPILILAGDVCNPRKPLAQKFMEYCSINWEKVYYIAGNHEYYNAKGQRDTMQQRDDMLAKLCNGYPNIHYCGGLSPGSAIDLGNGTTLLLTTLWTSPTSTMINDFNVIYMDSGTDDPVHKLSVYDMRGLNSVAKTWLREQISQKTGKIIVATHHLPSTDLILDKYMALEFSKMTDCFANFDMVDLLESGKVSVWIAGHTHGCKSVQLKSGTLLTANTKGYPGEGVTGYKPDACIKW